MPAGALSRPLFRTRLLEGVLVGAPGIALLPGTLVLALVEPAYGAAF